MTRSRDNATNVAGDISGVTAGTGLSGGGTDGAVTLNLSTPVASTNGGTGLSSFTTGDIIYSSSGNTLAKLGIGTTSQVLTVASGIPSWAAPAGSTLPAFYAYGVGINQTLIANTNTKVTFNTEEYDTDSCFASSRFTPTKAGYYVMTCYVATTAPNSTTTRLYLWKNGAAYVYLDSVYATNGDADLSGTAQVYLNGTTDYVEIYAFSGQATVIAKNIEYGIFQGVGATA